MQEKPSNPIDSEPPSEPFPGESDAGEPQDFLGLGATGDEAIDPMVESPSAEVSSESAVTPLHADEATQTLEESTSISDDDASWLQELDEGTSEPVEEGDDWGLGEEEEGTMSWLMELDVEDEQLLAQNDESLEEQPPPVEEEVVVASGGRAWLGRLLITTVSIGAGFGAARYLTDWSPFKKGRAPQPPMEPVAAIPTETAPIIPPAEPVAEVGPSPAEPVADLGPVPAEPLFDGPWLDPQPEVVAETPVEPEAAVAVETAITPPVEPGNPTEPEGPRRAPMLRNPFRTLTGPPTGGDGQVLSPFALATHTPATRAESSDPVPAVTIEDGSRPGVGASNATTVADLEAGRERRTQTVKIEDMILLPEDLGNRIREASAGELSGVWAGASIPMEAIEGNHRLMTPAVGRVRVLLGSGEIFEGELYAVGKKKVWLETELGKMALLSWQVHRIEHILTTTGLPALGADGSQDLAGLAQVRVRTPGGVFYGKVIDRDENAVTLVTAEGARITLRDAIIDPAGKSAIRLIDASGAEEDPEEPVKETE